MLAVKLRGFKWSTKEAQKNVGKLFFRRVYPTRPHVTENDLSLLVWLNTVLNMFMVDFDSHFGSRLVSCSTRDTVVSSSFKSPASLSCSSLRSPVLSGCFWQGKGVDSAHEWPSMMNDMSHTRICMFLTIGCKFEVMFETSREEQK